MYFLDLRGKSRHFSQPHVWGSSGILGTEPQDRMEAGLSIMAIRVISGNNGVSTILFWVAIAFVAADFLATLVVIIYQRFWYQKVIRPKFDPVFSPRCSIIVPCKGAGKSLKSNLESFFAL